MCNKIKNLIFLFLLTLSANQLQAQEQKMDKKQTLTSEERAIKISLQLKEKLALNEEQTSKVKSIILEREISHDEEMEVKMEQRKKWHDAISQLLTPEQLVIYKKLQEDRKNQYRDQKQKNHQE